MSQPEGAAAAIKKQVEANGRHIVLDLSQEVFSFGVDSQPISSVA
jgi:hypothetical protein